MTADTGPARDNPSLDFAGEVPEARGEEATYFDYCQQEELRIQRCSACSAYVFYPRSVCPTCFSRTLEWVLAKGTGVVHTFTVQHREPSGFEGQAPYTVAMIALDEGVLMMSRVVADPNTVHVGMPVQVAFAKVAEDFKVPVFTPTGAADG